MYRYTTPTLPLTISDLDFDTVAVFRVAIEQGDTEMLKIIEADDPSIDAQHKTIYVPLTQEETAALKTGSCGVQVRYKTTGGAVGATNAATVNVNDVYDEVII